MSLADGREAKLLALLLLQGATAAGCSAEVGSVAYEPWRVAYRPSAATLLDATLACTAAYDAAEAERWCAGAPPASGCVRLRATRRGVTVSAAPRFAWAPGRHGAACAA